MKIFHQEIKGKFAIGILLFVLFGAIVVLFFFLNSPSTNSGTITGASPTPISSFDPAVNGRQYTTEKYSMTYPNTWTPSSLEFEGGNTAIIKPQGVSGNPMIAVESYNQTEDVVQKQLIYLAEGCKPQTITINEQEYKKLYCVFHQRKIDGQLIQGTTQQQIVYIPKPEALYVVKFYYSSEQSNPEYDAVFIQMLSSMKFTQ